MVRAGVATVLVLLSWATWAQLPREFTIDAPAANMRGIVVSLNWSGSTPELLQAEVDGLVLPATAREGQVMFVVPFIPAGKALTGRIVAAESKRAPRILVESGEGSNQVTVRMDGELLTRYWHGPSQRKPYLWPLNSQGEVGLTRDWPMGDRVKTIDHEHHQSVWTAYGHVNGADFWEYNERTGWQQTDSVSWGSGNAVGWVQATNTWVDANRDPVIREQREYRFYAGDPARRLIDVDITLTAEYGAVHFEDTKEGGFIALRIRDELRERGGSGTITNSEGGVGARDCWGKPAAWVDYSGPLDALGVRGIAVFDHPSSFRHPSYWHARDYGLVAANPFGLSDFTDGRLNGDYTLPAGESISFHYRMLLHTGDAIEAAVSEYYAGFAYPADARWTGTTN